MIVVVADDFTGAAEIGGIGLKYGLSVEIFTKWPVNSNADLIVFDTNSRSKTVEEAISITQELTHYIKSLSPTCIFKKIDSVLRGHIMEETLASMNILERKLAIVIPPNPKLGRVIKNGIYYINDIPIIETSFTGDPEYSINSSVVTDILSADKIYTNLYYCNPDDMGSKEGIIVGEVKDIQDMEIWASNGYESSFKVGSAGFFEAILVHKGNTKKSGSIIEDETQINNRIIIIGSAYSTSREFVKNANQKGFPVSFMSDSIFEDDKVDETKLDKWKDEIVSLLRENNELIVAIGQPVIKNPKIAVLLKRKISRVIQKVNAEIIINEFLVEGGATASELLELLDFSILTPVYQYNQGVIRLKIKNQKNINFVLKPGSYEWPNEVLTIN